MTPETDREKTPIDFQAELHHLDEHIRSKMASLPETNPDKREQIEGAARAVEDAKERFFLLGHEGSGDAELLRLLNLAQQSARSLDMGENGSGPPLA